MKHLTLLNKEAFMPGRITLDSLIRPVMNKPCGFGEFLAASYVPAIIPDVFWWQGTWIRGMRYMNFTDLRPFTLRWAWTTGTDDRARQNLANSYAPVALFDKEYDRLGIIPIKDEKYPELHAGKDCIPNAHPV